MSKIIIQLMGGLVQDVFLQGTGKPTGYITVDEDEDADAEDITTVNCKTKGTPLGVGTYDYKAVVGGPYGISKLPRGSDVDKMVKAFLKNGYFPFFH